MCEMSGCPGSQEIGGTKGTFLQMGGLFVCQFYMLGGEVLTTSGATLH